MNTSKTTISVSVGFTAYNCRDTLVNAVQSAINQTYPIEEIIIVDDYSTDGTQEKIFELAASFKNIKFHINKTNEGVASSRNTLIQLAKGDFLAFFDDDDISNSKRVERQLEQILAVERKHETKSIICHSARLVKHISGKVIYQPCIGQTSIEKTPFGKSVSKAIFFGSNLHELKGSCPTCCQMARTENYRKLSGFDEKMRRSEDTEFCIRAAEAGYFFTGSSKPLVQQKMNLAKDKNISIELKNWQYLIRKHKKIIQKYGDYEFLDKWLNFKFKWFESNYKDSIFILFLLLFSHPIQCSKKLVLALPNIKINAALSNHYKFEKIQKSEND